ncbi:MAG: hypothetical protein JO243_11460 [Solirubrobacterales bacterium]|nr:hypothetical protein [Solirubrobacterales bacterium]
MLATRARLPDRITARLRAHRLDSELAAGAAPGERVALAIRAQALGERRNRTTLAVAIRRVLDEARGPRKPSIAPVPLHRRAVLSAADQLEELAGRLLAPGPLAARGIAQVRLLLTDGRSPIYYGGASQELAAAASQALTDLQPTFGW